MTAVDQLNSIMNKVLSYCRKEDWTGYDPFDALNSKIFILRGSRIFRQAWLQMHKRSLINFRNLLAVEKSRNPKGVGLFVSGLINLYKKDKNEEDIVLAQELLAWLEKENIDGGWGYNFDWQSRSFFAPKNTPNMITTVFVADAFLDAFDVTKNEKYLRIGLAAGSFILNKLNIHNDKEDICFSYTPLDKTRIHNVNLLGGALLTRLHKYSQEISLLEFAQKAVSFSIKYQNVDGSWFYGMDNNQRWIDGFHTGYNLVALKRFIEYAKDNSSKKAVEKGYEYYKNNLFSSDLVPKYYPNGKYPIDIHNVAQAIITFTEFGDFDLTEKVIGWAVENMWDNKGYFYYQKYRFLTNKIPYMRWSQAWMFFALSEFLKKTS